ncbi:MAG: class I SAM-dependent methyltransferase [Syntrophothermus sp.]
MYKDQCFLQFDEYFRFRAVAELIDAIGRKGLTVLDVGGGAGRFLNFLPEHKAISVDKRQGVDGSSLPYGDRSFDVVTSIDVLEHLPKADRPGFIKELVRVGRLKVFLAFPHAGATGVTRIVNQFTNGWLEEHVQLGLPSEEEVEEVLMRLYVTYRKYPNLDLATWVAMTIADWYAPAELKRPLNEEFNRHFYRTVGPCYRWIYEIEPVG